VPAPVPAAIRSGEGIPDSKLSAVFAFANEMTVGRDIIDADRVSAIRSGTAVVHRYTEAV
jgi:hypothetical protein